MANVEILNVDNIEDTNKYTFTLTNVEVCIPNSLRRTILNNIETLVFRGFPYNSNNINIISNKTRFNNEYLKHRISCIPIFNNDTSTFGSFKENYKIIINEENTTLEKKYVTTEDIKIMNKNTNKEISKEDVMKIFPSDNITGDYILICILYPNFNSNEPNEELYLEADFDIGTAEENSCWNVVENCVYEYVRDEEKIEEKLNSIDDPYEKKNFKILDAQRICHKNEYKMTVESLGIYNNNQIISMACDYIKLKLSFILQYFNDSINSEVLTKEQFKSNITNGTISKEEKESLYNSYCNIYKEDNFYIIELSNDDYTIGKCIEIYLYKLYSNDFSMIAFKKEHPTQSESYIYIKHKNSKVLYNQICTCLINTINELLTIFNKIDKTLKSN